MPSNNFTNAIPFTDPPSGAPSMNIETGNLISIQKMFYDEPTWATNPNGILYVSKEDDHPVRSHTKSWRIHTPPLWCSGNLDCQEATVATRGYDGPGVPYASRVEIHDSTADGTNSDGFKEGETGVYGFSVFIPSDVDLLHNDFGTLEDLTRDPGEPMGTIPSGPHQWVPLRHPLDTQNNVNNYYWGNTAWQYPGCSTNIMQLLNAVDTYNTTWDPSNGNGHSPIIQLKWRHHSGLTFDIADDLETIPSLFQYNRHLILSEPSRLSFSPDPNDLTNESLYVYHHNQTAPAIPVEDQLDRWIDIKFKFVASSSDSNGLLEIYVNNILYYRRENNRTLIDVSNHPDAGTQSYLYLRWGIYNSHLYYAIQPAPLTLYYDNIYKKRYR